MKGKKPGKQYGWQHYEWTPEIWAGIRRFELPKNEHPHTILLGAFVLAMHQVHKVDLVLTPRGLSGKDGKLAKECWEFFLSRAAAKDREAGRENDPIDPAAMTEMLDYVKWFVTCDDKFLIQAGRPKELLLTTSTYQSKYPSRTIQRSKSALHQPSGGRMVHTAEERRSGIGSITLPPNITLKPRIKR